MGDSLVQIVLRCQAQLEVTLMTFLGVTVHHLHQLACLVVNIDKSLPVILQLDYTT